MSIGVGERIPSVEIQVWHGGELTRVSTQDFFAGKRVLMVCMPGAFTPTCSREHLPGYVRMAQRLRAQNLGVVCMAVNDPWVMHAWAEQHGAVGLVDLLPDGNGELTRALGLELDAAPFGMGLRCQRASLLIDHGKVAVVRIEPDPGVVTSTAAAACIPEA